MADIQFKFNAEDLEKIQKMLDAIAKSARDIVNATEKFNPVSKDGTDTLKKQIADAKLLRQEKQRIEREEANHTKKMQQDAEKLKLADDRLLLGKQKLVNQQDKFNASLTRSKENTNTWEKALGSFQFKFNALGNIAANVLGGMSTKILSVIGNFISFERIIKSTDGSADKFEFTMAAVTGAFDMLNKAIAKGDLKGLFENMTNAANAAYKYAEAMDLLEEKTRSESVVESTLRAELAKTRIEVKKKTEYTVAERLKMSDRILEIDQILQDTQVRLASEGLKNILEKYKGYYGLYESEQKKFIEVYSTNLETANKVNRKLSLEARFEPFGNVTAAKGNLLTLTKELNGLNKEFENDKGLQEWYDLFKKAGGFSKDELDQIAAAMINVNKVEEQSNTGKLRRITENQNLKAEIAKEDKEAYDKFIKDSQATVDAYNKIATAIDNVRFAQESLAEAAERALAATKAKEEADLEAWKSGKKLGKGLIEASDELARADEENLARKEDGEAAVTALREKWAKEDEAKVKASEDEKKKIIIDSLGAVSDVSNSLLDLRQAKNDAAMEKELAAAEGNEAKQEEIKKKYAKRQQDLDVKRAIINNALAISKTFAEYGFTPPAIIAAAAMAVTGGIQIAAIKAQKFAKGGQIEGKLHSEGGTIIEAEKGEYVINRKSTGKYRGLIEGINQDDQMKIMASLHMDRAVNAGRDQDKYTKLLYEHLSQQEIGYETPEFFVIRKGTKTTKLRKHV
jgi:hypothetical protein